MVHVISFKLLYFVEETDVVDPPTMTTSLSGTARKKKWQILKKYIKQTSVLSLFVCSTKYNPSDRSYSSKKSHIH